MHVCPRTYPYAYADVCLCLNQVQDWLSKLRLPELQRILAANHVSGSMLSDMDESVITSMEVFA